MNNDSVINIDLIQNEAIISKMGYQDSACKIIVFSNTMTNCSCVNLNTYTCTTDPMTRLNNTDLWTCNATVEGLVFQSNVVSIDVRVPIVSVIISPDSDKYMTLNEEDELLLTCEASYGMPAANITWFMNNKTTDFNGSFNISNLSIINVTENEDGTKNTQSTLTYSVGRKDHGMEVYCNASNEDDRVISSKTIRLNVNYLAEKQVYINGNKSYDTFYMIRNSGTKQTLQCEVHGGNPLANLSWSCYNGTQTYMNTPSSAISNVSWFAGEWNESTCTCNASHALGWNQSQTVSVHVLFKPERIECEVGNAELIRGILNVTLYSNITIQCSSDGNPKPTNFTWIWPTGNTSTGKDISFVNIHRGNHGSYTLMVENVMTPSIGPQIRGNSNATLDINVQYPPDIPVILVNSTCMKNSMLDHNFLQVLELDRVSVECFAAGNPDPTCQWINHSQSSTLNFPKASKTDIGTYACQASNTMNTSYGITVVGRNDSSFYLDILYPPKITNLNTMVEVIEGVNFSLICNTEPGKPNATSYSWTSTHQPERNTSDQNLKIHNISRTDEGVFTCLAKNKMYPTGCQEVKGSDMEHVYVDVQYMALITTFTVQNSTVYHGDQFILTCEVDSDPPADISIVSPVGTTLNYTCENNQLHYIKNSSCLEDIGQFSCVSENKHNRNQPDRRNVTVDVRCAPMYKHNERPTTVVSTTPGGKAVLYFSVFSNPFPSSIIWKNLTYHMVLSTDHDGLDRVTINTTEDNSTSVVTITNVGLWDLSDYSVTAENDFGILKETFRIILNDSAGSDGGTSTSTIFDNATGPVIGGIVAAVCSVVIIAVLIVKCVNRKRQSGLECDRRREECVSKDDTQYVDISMVHRRTVSEYKHLDFQRRTAESRLQTPLKDSVIYENLKLPSTQSNALT
ncbi:hemicentin-1-like isoform X2 [Mya arenaria]|nr:hemicentin-1-like isoform X2 [Mya arenaria]